MRQKQLLLMGQERHFCRTKLKGKQILTDYLKVGKNLTTEAGELFRITPAA